MGENLKSECSYQILSVNPLFPVLARKTCLKRLTSVVWRSWWLEFLLDTLLNQFFDLNLLILSEDVVQQLLFTDSKVGIVIGPDDGWNASPEDKRLNASYKTADVHWWYCSKMDRE